MIEFRLPSLGSDMDQGQLVEWRVRPGQAVKRGEVLLVIESMKLETSLGAPRDGLVATVGVAAGATFDRGAVLATLETENKEA